MKKLNRKGFTLIELLAVIVILAIVVVVTIPSVLNSINKAKESSLSNATATVTEWFTKQYELSTLGTEITEGPSNDYNTFINTLANQTIPNVDNNGEPTQKLTPEVLKAAGITNTTGLEGYIGLNGTKICIKLTANDTKKDEQGNVTEKASQFFVKNGTNNTVKGSGC